MITLSTADNALKEVYLGVLANQLNTTINPLLSRINQTTSDVWGKEIRKVAPYGINGGIGAGTEDGALPTASATNYAQFVLPLKNLYGKIEISDKAIRASESSTGAFVNLLNSEMENLLKSSAFNLKEWCLTLFQQPMLLFIHKLRLLQSTEQQKEFTQQKCLVLKMFCMNQTLNL